MSVPFKVLVHGHRKQSCEISEALSSVFLDYELAMDPGERLHFPSRRSYQFSQRLFFSSMLENFRSGTNQRMIMVFCKFQD